jgi:hypothetical protein
MTSTLQNKTAVVTDAGVAQCSPRSHSAPPSVAPRSVPLLPPQPPEGGMQRRTRIRSDSFGKGSLSRRASGATITDWLPEAPDEPGGPL